MSSRIQYYIMMADAMAALAEGAMNSSRHDGWGLLSSNEKTKLSPKQKKRRKNSKLAKMSRKRNRRK